MQYHRNTIACIRDYEIDISMEAEPTISHIRLLPLSSLGVIRVDLARNVCTSSHNRCGWGSTKSAWETQRRHVHGGWIPRGELQPRRSATPCFPQTSCYLSSDTQHLLTPDDTSLILRSRPSQETIVVSTPCAFRHQLISPTGKDGRAL